jgi:two-component system, OmpR family, KDP operon response regulator KdpE
MDVTGSSGSTESSESVLRILAVDDDPVNRSLIRAIVSRASDASIRGATLHEATNLAEARSVLGREAIDILLLDVHLPDGLGLDLAAEIRHDGRSAPAILALTASVLPADQQAALDAGCDAFLAKPYAASALVATIGELARLSRARASS